MKAVYDGLFIESSTINGEIYGLTPGAVEAVTSRGLTCIVVTGTEGCDTLKKKWRDAASYIFIMPPGLSAIESRLIARGDEVRTISDSLKSAEVDLRFINNNPDFFDRLIQNEDIAQAATDLIGFINQ